MITETIFLKFSSLRQDAQAFALCFMIASGGLSHADPLIFQDFTYTVENSVESGTWVNIIDYPTTAIGAVVIPATIDGWPVRNIGEEAFFQCALITSVSIPENVIFIGTGAFTACAKLASVALPTSLETIEAFAFSDCDLLTQITIPAFVSSIGNRAFDDNNSFLEATFLGNAPGDIGVDIFGTNSLVRVNYLSGKAGFTSPRWRARGTFIGYQSFARTSLEMWLILNGMPFDQDMLLDSNGDGVNLLMAYALNLDPKVNLSGRLPLPTFSSSQMAMTFYAGRPDVTYAVVASENLVSWTDTDVTLTPLDLQQMRTATVAISGQPKFMRLVVTR